MKRNYSGILQVENLAHPTPGDPVIVFGTAAGQSARRDGIYLTNNSSDSALYVAIRNQNETESTLSDLVSATFYNEVLLPGQGLPFPVRGTTMLIIDSELGTGNYTATELVAS